MRFKEVKNTIDFPELELKTLKFWRDTDAFKKRVALNKGKKRWSFIDGPITANNPMGVHHAWGRTYKDLYQRYHSMKGFDLRYQNGFDCQGLWIEVEVERDLGFKSKKDIEAYGIAEFIKKCKQRALRFAAIQVKQSIRLGYWMDWDDPNLLSKLADGLERPEEVITVQGPKGSISESVEQLVGKLGTPELGGSYFTFSDENNYAIWAVLKECYKRGWIYKGRDVMPWCPRCSTALSQHEIVTEGYREIIHLGLTLKFPLRGRPNESLLIWTTTPWTLSSNVAVAVHPEISYVKVLWKGELLYLAKAALNRVFAKESFKVVETLTGMDMNGWTYDGPFDELPAEQGLGAVNDHRVILWREVGEEEGTGIVHIAPGCGKEDLELGKEYNLSAVAPLNEFGVFIEGFDWLTGVNVYDSVQPIIENLKQKDLLFKVESYKHRYPVCWRCSSELVFRLVDEWFISMGRKIDKTLDQIIEQERQDNLRYQIMEVAEQICWIPSFGLNQELDWLKNMDDWMISKKRYWGLALPIWDCKKCGNFDVIGSREELKSRAVDGWMEFECHTPHRHWIDLVKIACSKCGAVTSRIQDVGNPWLDAGIVSYSTLNYHHDKEYWKKWFPADFICESWPGQFRNWFYSMLVMSTIIERLPPFLTCFGHGSVLTEDGQQMHKSWGNVIWFDEAVENMGADVMRWNYCSSRPEKDMLFGYDGADEVKRRFLLPFWNIYSFFVTYARLDDWKPNTLKADYSLLDRWILSELQTLVRNVTFCLDKFNAFTATAHLEQFVNKLSTWYVRRSRRRFWKSEADVDKDAAYKTLYTCLTSLTKLLAPFIPFTTEEVYQNLVSRVRSNAPKSVHHNDWPKADTSLIDEKLAAKMDLTIIASRLGRSARSKARIKLRQPLLKAKVVAEKNVLNQLEDLIDLIKNELNVKQLDLTTRKDELIAHEVKLLPRLLGKKYGRKYPKLVEVVAGMDAKALAESFANGSGVDVEVEGLMIKLLPEEVEVQTIPKKGYVVMEEQDIMVGVDVVISEELRIEGLARTIVRHIQNQRKKAAFKIADQIETYYVAGSKLKDAFTLHENYICAETLSTSIHNAELPEGCHMADLEIDGEPLRIGLIRKLKT